MFNENELLEESMFNGDSAASVLFFDFEWIPNQEILDRIRPKYEIQRTSYDSLISPEKAVSNMKVDDFKEYVLSKNPCADWLQHALEISGKLKGKKTIGDFCESQCEKILSGGIPSEVMHMAETQKIITMSWATGYGPVQQIAFNESIICEELAKIMLQRVKPAGWAIRTSDIPVFLAACARNKVNPFRSFDLKHGSDILDMYEIRFGRGAKGKLQDLAAVTGFQADDPLRDGGEVLEFYQQGRMGDILEHNRIDILKLQHVHKHYAGIYW